jgi:hypothetical protein
VRKEVGPRLLGARDEGERGEHYDGVVDDVDHGDVREEVLRGLGGCGNGEEGLLVQVDLLISFTTKCIVPYSLSTSIVNTVYATRPAVLYGLMLGVCASFESSTHLLRAGREQCSRPGGGARRIGDHVERRPPPLVPDEVGQPVG